MSFLLDLGVAYLAGLVAFLVAPVLTAPLPWQYARRVLRPYWRLMMGLVGTGILIQLSDGAHVLKRATRTEFGTYKVRLNGDWKHYEDPHNYMSTLFGYPFGYTTENSSVIVNPRVADVSRRYRELHEDGRWEVASSAGETFKKAFFALDPDVKPLVSAHEVVHAVQGSATADLAERVNTYVEKGQSEFNTTRAVQYMVWLGSLGAGFGMMYLAYKLRSGGGGGGATVPVPIVLSGVLPL